MNLYKKYKSRYLKLKKQLGGVHVYTDYDDTCVAAGKIGMAGFDQTFKSHIPYPGQAKLYEALTKYRISTDGTKPEQRGDADADDDILILTARPTRYLGKGPEKFKEEAKLHKDVTVLWGELGASLGWASNRSDYVQYHKGKPVANSELRDAKLGMGISKFRAWEGTVKNFKDSEPRRKNVVCHKRFSGLPFGINYSVFFGDDAQGDIHATIQMINYLKSRDCQIEGDDDRPQVITLIKQDLPLFRAYIHLVLHRSKEDVEIHDRYKPYVCFYKNSIDAAKDAMDWELISPQNYVEIYDSFISDLIDICQQRKIGGNPITWKHNDIDFTLSAIRVSSDTYIRITKSDVVIQFEIGTLAYHEFKEHIILWMKSDVSGTLDLMVIREMYKSNPRYKPIYINGDYFS